MMQEWDAGTAWNDAVGGVNRTMYSRWFNLAIFVLWVGMMTWLVVAKVLPPLREGDPPSYRTIVEAQKADPLVCWRMSWNDRSLGWAVCTTEETRDAVSEIDFVEVRSWVHFDEFPLTEMAPGLIRAFLGQVAAVPDDVPMDVRSMVRIDSLGHLTEFESTVGVDPTLHAAEGVVKIRGHLEGQHLRVLVQLEGLPRTVETYVPRKALLSDSLSPQTHLPGLRTGQTWTVKTYSFLRLPGLQDSPTEVLQARVTGMEPIDWNHEVLETFLVVYRSDPGSELGGADTTRARLWVRPDGTVLRQEVSLFGSKMTFDRLPAAAAAELAATVGVEPVDAGWSAEPPTYRTMLREWPGEDVACWTTDWNGAEVGWAVNSMTKTDGQPTRLDARVHFNENPLMGIVPPAIRTLIRVLGDSPQQLPTDLTSAMTIDESDQLTDFEATLGIGPLTHLVSLHGEIEGETMNVSSSMAMIRQKRETQLPEDALPIDVLTPLPLLPALHGRLKWPMPAFTLLGPAGEPVELLWASVEGKRKFPWNDRFLNVWHVVLKAEDGGIRARLWVRGDGMVLKHQVRLFGSTMTFNRLPRDKIGPVREAAFGAPSAATAPETETGEEPTAGGEPKAGSEAVRE